ncbi:hypothetical protein Ndes2526B_g00505 [Nannochloris sp. 'desiccata']|nr:hypothetical protein NADE_003672 [Chlorella desiccata (nom. nud.)]
MQTNQPEGGPQSPSQQRRGTLDAENDRPQDPRPLGGSDTPHQHPFPTKSMDPRPLGAGKSVPGEIEAEDTEQDDNNKAAAAKGPLHDEVDASPEEQFTRHHVELDPERIHHMQYHKEGPLEQVKKKATDVVRAARAAVEQHLPSNLTTNDDTTSNPANTPQSNITLHNLKYDNHPEPMHMAKIAEGRNRVIDTDDRSSRKVGMSPASAAIESGGSSAVGGGAGVSKEDDDFPETLQDAIQDGAHLSEKAKEKESKEEDDQVGADLNEPEPFGVTSGARSKL